ncbi:MAG: iron-containing alcohol dehydrogenase [Gammaproteobacteria bacterium]|jgi:alcohol dehydrogenase
MIAPFRIARIPRIEFGSGSLAGLPQAAARHGHRALLVTGARSLQAAPAWGRLQAGLDDAGIRYAHLTVAGEPSPQMVDAAVRRYHPAGMEVVVAIGGGSVLDAGKAIAGLLPSGDSVMDYLEGVGPEKPYQGPAVPFIAVPTTAGTGSEATKNAVLSIQGEGGFKKSFRDEQLVPELALVDPDLLATCPPGQIAANGMDALTQLIESCVSTGASRMSGALALDGIRAARDSLLVFHDDPAGAAGAREGMAYAALVSGITLAQTGLGSVHGLASPLGAWFPIPHGVVCGALMATATRINIRALRERDPQNPALETYARIGEILHQKSIPDREQAADLLVELLEEWTRYLRIPALGQFGIGQRDFASIVAGSRGSSMKTNPIVLCDAEIGEILEHCL